MSQRDGDREIETARSIQRDRDREIETERSRHRDRDREIKTERLRHRYRDIKIETERSRQRDRGREIETERSRQRVSAREKEREREVVYLDEEGNLVGEHTAGHQTHSAGPTQNRQTLDKEALPTNLIRFRLGYGSPDLCLNPYNTRSHRISFQYLLSAVILNFEYIQYFDFFVLFI